MLKTSVALALCIALSSAASARHDDDDDGGRSHSLSIRTVSTPAERVSGGDALVEIRNAGGEDLEVKLNGRDVTAAFGPGTHPDTLIGLVTGLEPGKNKLTADARGRDRETLVITNYPLSGPITSGPHVTPFICQTHSFLLPDGTPYTAQPVTDPSCAAPTKITYLYMPAGGTTLVPLPSTTELPPDVAMTTTKTGATVRFIVRVETSTINRGIYQSAVLHDPTVDPEPSPFAPPAGWNRRLIAVQGFGCPGGWYIQGASIGSLAFGGMDFRLLSPERLGEGYALFSNTLQHPSSNCNAVLAGEAAMMSKEHFIETYGVPRYTVSAGCSGGSYGSIQLADALPGLIDGALIACTFPDPLSIALSGSDGHLLARYFTVTDPAGFTKEQQVAVSGYKFSGADGTLAFIDAARQSGRTDPVPGRVVPGIAGYASAPFNSAVPVAVRYDPVANPGGARGTVYDAARNVYGIGRNTGFALRPFDNVGVQYGLQALNAGVITVQQFLDLNERIGGFDEDANYTASRSSGDAGAIRRAYQSGLQFTGSGGLASIPLVDITGIYNDDSGYHYQWFHFAARERMARSSGRIGNHVMWRGAVPYAEAWSMFIAWVEAIAADEGHGPDYDRVVRNKPANAHDGCWASATEFVAEPQTFGAAPDSVCNTLFPSYAFPRYVAGGPLAADILKCRLEPVRRHDYAVAFTDEEFARLRKIFPQGVCDWSRRGRGQADVVPWASFGPSRDNLVFDVTRGRGHDDDDD
ncbi:MAG TPA: DUF6351 family protein [Burkholderiales bacterium]|nr:DUF6351 family protein [Burkholderiales bacterium]